MLLTTPRNLHLSRRTRLGVATVGLAALLVTVASPVSPAAASGDGELHVTAVSSVGGGPLSGATVRLWNDAGDNIDLATADTNGVVVFDGLAYDYYAVSVDGLSVSPNHVESYFFGDSPNHDGATFIQVPSDVPVHQVLTVIRGGVLSGTVSGEFGPPDNGRVALERWNGASYDFVYTQVRVIEASGAWTSAPLWPGDYRVGYDVADPTTTEYRQQWHDQQLDDEVGVTRVSVVDGGQTSLSAHMSRFGPVPHERLAGADRYATANAVAQQFASFGGASGTFVYVAFGGNYPDALSAAPAAAFRSAPLLLNPSSTLLPSVRAEIERLEPRRILVVGGAGVISAAVETELQSLVADPDDVVRLGGADRYDTARLVVQNAFATSGSAFIATGRNFPDALAASAAAAKLNAPVILLDGLAATVPVATRQLIDDLGISQLYLAGGTGVISSAIAAQLADIPSVTDVDRLGGTDRYETSLMINQEVFSSATPEVYFAVGTGYADALAGAALAGSRGYPLYSTPPTCIPSATMDHLLTRSVVKAWLLGGTGVLAPSVASYTRC